MFQCCLRTTFVEMNHSDLLPLIVCILQLVDDMCPVVVQTDTLDILHVDVMEAPDIRPLDVIKQHDISIMMLESRMHLLIH